MAVKYAVIIVEDAWDTIIMGNNKSLVLEIIRLKSICLEAKKELCSIYDMIEEDLNIAVNKNKRLINSLEGASYDSFIEEYPHLKDEHDLIKNL